MPKLVRLDGTHHVSYAVTPPAVFQPSEADSRPHAIVTPLAADRLMRLEAGQYMVEAEPERMATKVGRPRKAAAED